MSFAVSRENRLNDGQEDMMKRFSRWIVPALFAALSVIRRRAAAVEHRCDGISKPSHQDCGAIPGGRALRRARPHDRIKDERGLGPAGVN
jgi:hypothetical protein